MSHTPEQNKQQPVQGAPDEKLRKEFNEKFDIHAFEFPRIRGEVADFWIAHFKAELSALVETLKERQKNLVTKNDNVPMNCNPRCHDSGKDDAIEETINYIKNLL